MSKIGIPIIGFLIILILAVFWPSEEVLSPATQNGVGVQTSTGQVVVVEAPLKDYRKIELALKEDWGDPIYLAAGESIHVWGNPNVIGQSESNDWIEYLPSTPNLYGTSYWFKFRAKEGTGRMQYCIFPKGRNPNEFCG